MLFLFFSIYSQASASHLIFRAHAHRTLFCKSGGVARHNPIMGGWCPSTLRARHTALWDTRGTKSPTIRKVSMYKLNTSPVPCGEPEEVWIGK